jgi:O-antigen/teichoic acid export membrane protein
MIVGIFFTSDFLIQQMYGSQYASSATILKICSVLLLISPVGYLLGSRMLLVSDHEDKMVICVGLGAVVNLIGNALLIPRLHEFGAAITTLISEFIVMIVYVLYGKSYFRLVNIGAPVMKTFVAAMFMGAYLFVWTKIDVDGWFKLIVQIVGAFFLYIIILFFEKEETTKQYIALFMSKIKNKSIFKKG